MSKSKAKKARKRQQKAAKARAKATAVAVAGKAMDGDATNASAARAAGQAAADSVEGGREAAQAAAVDAAGRLGVTYTLSRGKKGRAEAQKAAEAAISRMQGKSNPGPDDGSRRAAAEAAASIAVGVARAGGQATPTFIPKTRRQALNLAKFELTARNREPDQESPSQTLQALDLPSRPPETSLPTPPSQDSLEGLDLASPSPERPVPPAPNPVPEEPLTRRMAALDLARTVNGDSSEKPASRRDAADIARIQLRQRSNTL